MYLKIFAKILVGGKNAPPTCLSVLLRNRWCVYFADLFYNECLLIWFPLLLVSPRGRVEQWISRQTHSIWKQFFFTFSLCGLNYANALKA